MDNVICMVLDLDDTLYLERDYVRSGFRAVGQWCADYLGIAGIQREAEALFLEGKRSQIFDCALSRRGTSPNAGTVAAMVDVYHAHTPDIALLADSRRCLDRFSGYVPLYLLTDGNPVSQWAKIEALELRSRFDGIVVTGDWGTEFAKPHLRGYRWVELHSGWAGAHCAYIADNPSKDFFAPKKLGWSSIRVRRCGALHEARECPPGLVNQEIRNLDPLAALSLCRIRL